MLTKHYVLKPYIIFAFSSIVLSITLGAFGAHMWSDLLLGHRSTFDLANDYQTWVTLYIMIGILFRQNRIISSNAFLLAAIIGMILFSGSLYVLSFPDIFPDMARKICGPMTPIGGLSLILSALLALYEIVIK